MAEVTFDQVTKVFEDGTCAVSELSLDVADGEFMVLVGPSGWPASASAIVRDGRGVRAVALAQAVRRKRVGEVQQRPP